MLYIRHHIIRFMRVILSNKCDAKCLHLGVIYLSGSGRKRFREEIALVWRVKKESFGIPSGRIPT